MGLAIFIHCLHLLPCDPPPPHVRTFRTLEPLTGLDRPHEHTHLPIGSELQWQPLTCVLHPPLHQPTKTWVGVDRFLMSSPERLSGSRLLALGQEWPVRVLT